jgi:outer membrane protein assembly factor BamB
MSNTTRPAAWILSFLIGATAASAYAQDWPQWRGANRDAAVEGFTAPSVWPKTLAQKWKTSVGEGVATPALVGEKLFVFARQNDHEVISCLDAATGKEQWHDEYSALGANGPAAAYSGPRASPAVADGKVVTLGIHGMLSCYDAASGKKLWQKNDFQGSEPKFSTASSPILIGGLCIAQVGVGANGGVVAYDLTTGDIKWKWLGDGPDYASPALMTVGSAKLLIAETSQNVVAVNLADGKKVWETPFAVGGAGAYNAGSPVIDAQTIIYSGGKRGTHAVKIEQSGDGFTGKELWSNSQSEVIFNSPSSRPAWSTA